MAVISKSMSILRSRLLKHRELLLSGTVIAIDPSCVSKLGGSKPGYALFEGGEYQSQGLLDVEYDRDLAVRLQRIRETIQRDVDPKVVAMIIEETAVRPLRTKKNAAAEGKTFMNFQAISSLKQAIGATKSALTVGKPVIEIHAATWQAVCKNQLKLTISKNDDDDARLIGMAAFHILNQLIQKGDK